MDLLTENVREYFFKSDDTNENKTDLTFQMSYSIGNPFTELMFSKNIDIVSQRIVEAFKRKIEG